MKSVFLIALLIGSNAYASDFEKEREQAVSFAKSLQIGDCFRYEAPRKAKFSFEKDYVAMEHVHMLMGKDGEGLLVAQPDPDCKASDSESVKCDYWFRTVVANTKSLYLIAGNEKKVTCPKGMSLKEMIQKMKKSNFSKQFRIGE